MSTPGFTAENSLYKGTASYYTVAAVAQAQVEILQEFSSSASAEKRAPGLSLPVSRFRGGTSCDAVCHLDDTGACVRDCTSCPPGRLPDGCVDFTEVCPPSACCPPGQDACYAAHKAQFCCPPGLTCCHPETNLCCREQCCFDHCCGANENCCTLPGAPVGCCPADQVCTFQGCCNPAQACGTLCCPGMQICCGGVCKDKNTDPINCGGCGIVCPAPPNSSPVCANGTCDFACNSGFNRCGSGCCPMQQACCAGTCCPPGQSCCGGVCKDTNSDPNNCGISCKVCPPGPANSTPICANGTCDFVCNSGYSRCGNICTLLGTNQNCSTCNDVCRGGRICVGRRCVCPPNRDDCGAAGCCPVGQRCRGGRCGPQPPDCHLLHQGDSCAPPPGCRVCVPCGLSCNDNGPLSLCCRSNDGSFGSCCDPENHVCRNGVCAPR
jgi:hypothetical protein